MLAGRLRPSMRLLSPRVFYQPTGDGRATAPAARVARISAP